MISSNPKHLELLLNLVKIYSPSKKEDEIRNYIERLLRGELEADNVHVDSAGNVVAIYDGTEPTVLLSSHMDTVPGELPVRFDGERIFGRGASDAKGPLSAFMYSAFLLKRRERFPLKLIVTATSDEEGEGTGIKELPRTLRELGILPKFAVFGEPGNADAITIAYKGRIGLLLIISSKERHASVPAGENPIESAINVLNALKEYERANISRSSFFSISVEPTVMRCGEAHNVIPEKCELFLDVRLPPGKDPEQVLSELIGIISKSTSSKFDFHVKESVKPYQANISSPLINAFKEAILEVTAKEARLLRKTGTGEMNVFAGEFGIPVITYGPGEAKLSHTANEYIFVRDYELAIEVIRKALWLLYKNFK